MAYNLTNVTNAGNILDVVVGINQLTGEWFFIGMTFALFVIILVSLINKGPIPAFAAAGYLSGVTGILMILAGLIAPFWLTYYVLFMALITGGVFLASRKD